MHDKIPVTVIVTTLNEEKNLPRCLAALGQFDEVIVVDSGSQDNSRAIVESFGASFIEFHWNGQYPKKRQWCLDTLTLKHDYIFFVDADEEVTQQLLDEIAALDWQSPGYFIKGLYVIEGTILCYGLQNKKLCLFDRTKMEFPVVDDLDLPGMGEIEGHYQPVLKAGQPLKKIPVLNHGVLHHAFENMGRWNDRHRGYAAWERGMIEKKAYPKDPYLLRDILKGAFRQMPLRGWIIIAYYHVLKGGFLHGNKGLFCCLSKARYYGMVQSEKYGSKHR